MKKIIGFNNFYITKQGKVFNKKTQRFMSCTNKSGYLYVFIREVGNVKQFTVHGLMALVFNILKKCKKCGINYNLQVHHKDENKKNNNIKNLQAMCKFCHNSHHKKGIKYPGIVWNKGIKMPKEFCEKMSKLTSGKNNGFYGRSWDEFGGHPRGMLGKHHSEETKKRISMTSKLNRKKGEPQ